MNAKIGDRISVVRGTEVTIFCPVTGDPEPVTKWYVNGKPIDYRFDRNYRVSLKDGGTELKILNVVRGATSEYVCEATNEHGKAIGRGWVRPISKLITS